jgi:small acid-soluble spore protein F (minor alpha/beta-type SASP)
MEVSLLVKKAETKNGARKQTARPKKVDPLEPLKLEIAEELGLSEKVKLGGWDSLSAREAGRIGGFMTQRLRAQKQQSL